MKRNFNEWLAQFRDSISDYKYYVDFDKIYRNVDKLKIELNILNSLIGSNDIENDFEEILKKYPETLGQDKAVVFPQPPIESRKYIRCLRVS